MTDRIVDTIYTYRPRKFNPENDGAQFFLRIYQDADNGHTVVVLTEPHNNPGISVTNGAEWLGTAIVKDFNLRPELTTWIEHYPARYSSDSRSHSGNRRLIDHETVDLIRFTWNDRDEAEQPEWDRIERAQAEALIGEPLQPLTHLPVKEA